ncbi:hypothetical protein [Gluconobacter kanchanaburiensis]|uniref:Uncharacterized protein n=1 Tax=Gluconobacter kanchanaburiensis NBRC 103587 TaxID=1307948 RepID=A0A511B6L9_9PROT|nr:hypothetical protein [Gluconobacter kanchanaburiensis]MBF0860661.1 hypothetical protein [Gluconobacter kanchanaburiensis]GBR69563.1 hypothetical protein AA103587_1393 [Gluconobacter kanchanaburiensis NBRC 103587]GEK96076.1 hypothetical protein GKA01_12730 [Gluconobacter kanchanaburiensis NBRC 103587]
MSIRFISSSAPLLLAALAVMPLGVASQAIAADTAEKPCETDLCRTVRQSWAAVRHDTSDAAQWTKKQSVKGWDATKNGVSDAAHWTGKESRKGWDATKKGTKEAVHDTGAWTKKTVHDIDPGQPAKAPETKNAKTGD